MNLENKPCSELHIDAIRRELDLKMRSKKTFKNEGLGMPNGIFRTEKSFSMFWQLIEEPTVTDANVKPESPDERFKSLLRRHADPGQGEDFIERAFQQYKRIQKMLELERSQVVSDIGLDEKLMDNKLNVVFDLVMDAARKKSKVVAVVHDVHMDENRANKRKAVAESVMDENFNGATYKSRKVAFDADMDENLANNHMKKEPTVEIATSATQSDSKDPKSECPWNLIHQ